MKKSSRLIAEPFTFKQREGPSKRGGGHKGGEKEEDAGVWHEEGRGGRQIEGRGRYEGWRKRIKGGSREEQGGKEEKNEERKKDLVIFQ